MEKNTLKPSKYVQPIDFINFFTAQKIIKVLSARIGAALRPIGTGLPTKLSTGSVGEWQGMASAQPAQKAAKKLVHNARLP